MDWLWLMTLWLRRCCSVSVQFHSKMFVFMVFIIIIFLLKFLKFHFVSVLWSTLQFCSNLNWFYKLLSSVLLLLVIVGSSSSEDWSWTVNIRLHSVWISESQTLYITLKCITQVQRDTWSYFYHGYITGVRLDKE